MGMRGESSGSQTHMDTGPQIPVFKDRLVSLVTREQNLGSKFLLAEALGLNGFNLLIYEIDAAVVPQGLDTTGDQRVERCDGLGSGILGLKPSSATH